MRKITDVYDVFHIEGKGTIIGGTNKDLNLFSAQEITAFIGSEIEVCDNSGNCFPATVKGVEVQNSLIDSKNIFILISDNLEQSQMNNIKTIYSKR